MNYKKVLEKLGLVEGVDFALTESSFEMISKVRQVPGEPIHHEAIPAVTEEVEVSPMQPATFDEEGNVLTPEIPAVYEQVIVEPAVEAWDEPTFVDESYVPASPSLEVMTSTWEIVQLLETDIVLLINEYLSDKIEMRDFAYDSMNIVDGLIYNWDFKQVPQPTNAQLVALIPVVATKQAAKNRRDQLLAAGKKDREISDNCLAIIAGFNRERVLTAEQITAMQTQFSTINTLLLNARPSSAKVLIQAIVPDETITEEMKEMVLAELADV